MTKAEHAMTARKSSYGWKLAVVAWFLYGTQTQAGGGGPLRSPGGAHESVGALYLTDGTSSGGGVDR